MGLNQSRTNDKIRYAKKTHFSNNEIQSNITQLFNNNKKATHTDYSNTLNMNDSGYDTDPHSYNENQLHGGDSDVHNSEIEKVKNYLLNEIKKNEGIQLGGNINEQYNNVNDAYLQNQQYNEQPINIKALFGGAVDIDASSDIDTNIDDDDVESDVEEIDLDDDSESESSSEKPTATSSSRDGDKKKKPKVVGTRSSSVDMDSDKSSESEDKTPIKQQERAKKQHKKSLNRFSVSSYSTTSSDLNILPFYSSQTSNDHPYVKDSENKKPLSKKRY